jgi:uncharacterized protein
VAEFIGIVAVAIGAGTLGTMLGLGGGVFLVPILSLFFGVDLKIAIAASAIAVVANSCSGSAVYLRARFTNVRMALVMLTSMVAGALVGGFLAISLPESVLKGSFAALLLYVAIVMYRRLSPTSPGGFSGVQMRPDPHNLGGRYLDPGGRQIVEYVPHKFNVGIPTASLAGVASGMFGIGGGPITVPLYTIVMGVPVKAATSTSSFMFGMTASASAFVYYEAGKVDPSIAVPCVLGIITGAKIGATIASRVKARALAIFFIFALVALSISMALDGFGVY